MQVSFLSGLFRVGSSFDAQVEDKSWQTSASTAETANQLQVGAPAKFVSFLRGGGCHKMLDVCWIRRPKGLRA